MTDSKPTMNDSLKDIDEEIEKFKLGVNRLTEALRQDDATGGIDCMSLALRLWAHGVRA